MLASEQAKDMDKQANAMLYIQHDTRVNMANGCKQTVACSEVRQCINCFDVKLKFVYR